MKVWIVNSYGDNVEVYDNEEAAERDDRGYVSGPWEVRSALPMEFDPAQVEEYVRRRGIWESLPDRPGFIDWVKDELSKKAPHDRAIFDDRRQVRMDGIDRIIVPVLGGNIRPGGAWVEGDGTIGHEMNRTVWDPLKPGSATYVLEYDEWIGDQLVIEFGSAEWMPLKEVASVLQITFRDAQAAVDKDAGVFLLTPRRRKTPVELPTKTMGGKRFVHRQSLEEVLARR